MSAAQDERIAEAVRRAVEQAPPLSVEAAALLRATGLRPRELAR